MADPVWNLYEAALRRFGAVSTLIEWDDNIPSFERLEEESERARSIATAILTPAPMPAGRAFRAAVSGTARSEPSARVAAPEALR